MLYFKIWSYIHVDLVCFILLSCWSRCSSSAAEQSPDRSTPEGSGRCQLQLTVQRMVRNESLVVADISWAGGNRTKPSGGRLCPSTAGQCLVTWEVSGGGLMGNLLTESNSVQLSLWSDTNYRIQVTCRSKHANSPLVRSAPLTLNTSGAIMLQQRTTSTNNPVEMDRPEGELPWQNEIAEGDDDEALARELDDSGESTDTPSGKLHAWMVARDGENTLAILALFVAILLALLALLTIAALVRWRPGSGDSHDHIDKDVLVENELIVHTRYGS
ncbi:AGAP013158-PA-like protein [Anopheles sinensis]|uniref:AGAP013158-PA-like protein n=1 Tax=Anopheles sinensis TaxID=74873 RepID=A0A084WFN6_ANOSI|nr:AGAP013158-PA-like protein [Anopheles sinensis]